MNIEYVDAHCHADLFINDSSIIEEAEINKVHTIAVTNVPSVFLRTQNLSKGKKYIYPAVGLHPELVKTHGSEVANLWPILNETRFVGEVGLDYSTDDLNERQNQRDIFSAILLHCSEYKNKVITVHSRRAASDVIAAVGEKYPGKIILHWFTGTSKEVDRAINSGFWFSINLNMLGTSKGFELINKMPINRLLTETDGPFGKFNNNSATPKDVKVLVNKLSGVWKKTVEETAAIILENFKSVLS